MRSQAPQSSSASSASIATLFACFSKVQPSTSATATAARRCMWLAAVAAGAHHASSCFSTLGQLWRLCPTRDKGLTPIVIACIWMHTECTDMLARAGANLNVYMDKPTVFEWASNQLQRQRRVGISSFIDEQERRRARAAAAVMRATRWSPAHHSLFPRASVRELYRLGAQIPLCPLDVWVQLVMPHLLEIW